MNNYFVLNNLLIHNMVGSVFYLDPKYKFEFKLFPSWNIIYSKSFLLWKSYNEQHKKKNVWENKIM